MFQLSFLFYLVASEPLTFYSSYFSYLCCVGTSLDELLTVCGCVEDSASINDRTSLSKLHNAFMRKVEIRYGKDLQELFLEMPELFMNSTAIDEKDAILSSQEKMKSIEASLKVIL